MSQCHFLIKNMLCYITSFCLFFSIHLFWKSSCLFDNLFQPSKKVHFMRAQTVSVLLNTASPVLAIVPDPFRAAVLLFMEPLVMGDDDSSD